MFMLQSSGCFKKDFACFRSRGDAKHLLAHGAQLLATALVLLF